MLIFLVFPYNIGSIDALYLELFFIYYSKMSYFSLDLLIKFAVLFESLLVL